MEKEQKSENGLKRKVQTIPDDKLEDMMVKSEMSGREECQETIAGFIRLMQANDKPVFVNTNFIVFIEPEKIARYHYSEGSLLTLSISGTKGLQTLKVIEPCNVVLEAIEKSATIM